MPSYPDRTATDPAGNTENRDAIDAGIALAEPKFLGGGSVYAIAVPAGGDVRIIDRDLDKYRERPRRITGDVAVHDADAFVHYLAKHGLLQTDIYADVPAGKLTAIINAHQGVDDVDATVDTEGLEQLTAAFADQGAGWGDHRLSLALQQTPAWKAWAGYDRRMLNQVDFAEHIEERLADIVTPPGADMLELAQTFQATRSVAFESSKRLSNGQTQLAYREEDTATAGKKGQLQIPERFELALRPYEGTDPYKVTARLRYRINGPTLAIGYLLDRPDEILRAAFLDIVTDVADRTERTILNGTAPDAPRQT